ncbi:FAD:protein FMN transferase [Rubritalea sp.]|uniref:FAD:protein FMN transferase n=1 Tax=Rubritalea sp. TaxID=2109375 RepID=UPI003EFA7559
MSAELYQVDASVINDLDVEARILELEAAFSLYSDSSELSVLNRERVLHKPSALFLEVLELARTLSIRTAGYYQPAIHAAWSAMERGQLNDEYLQAASLENVYVGEHCVQLTDPLTELSFNAIIQGYLADKVSQHLSELGVKHALLHMGESYGIGSHLEGRPWSLGVMGAAVNDEADLVGTMQFADAGLAVSTHDATRKLLNPMMGESMEKDRVAAVVSKEGAAVADAFATAFTVAPETKWEELYQNLTATHNGAVKVWVENRLVFER